MPLLDIKDLCVEFDAGDAAVRAVDGVSLSVNAGETVCLVGESGSGKTVTALSIARLLPCPPARIRRGEIWLAGRSILELASGELRPIRGGLVAFVFQEPSSLPWLTVKQNVEFGMLIKGVHADARERRLRQILDLVGLADCANLFPNQISASMEQRVAVSRAFATNPDLLLMDEPYGQLDVKLRYYLEDELVKLWRELGATVIFVTHNIEEAVYVAERILVLTNKPTTVKAEIHVDLPRPRNFIDDRFIEIRKQVTDLIRWW